MRVRHPLGQDIVRALFLLGGRAPEGTLKTVLARLRTIPSKSAYDVALHRARRRGLVFRPRRATAPWVRLTPRGRADVALPPPRARAPAAPEGMVYFVTYDVPVELNAVRDEFRRRLRANGWRRLHMSLWISERDIRNTALEASEELGIETHVFIGTGALVKSPDRSVPEAEAKDARLAAAAVSAAAARNPAAAYRRWADLTAMLRGWARASALDDALRTEWEKATRDLRAALSRSES